MCIVIISVINFNSRYSINTFNSLQIYYISVSLNYFLGIYIVISFNKLSESLLRYLIQYVSLNLLFLVTLFIVNLLGQINFLDTLQLMVLNNYLRHMLIFFLDQYLCFSVTYKHHVYILII